MTNKQTIDGVSRELLERFAKGSTTGAERRELRALLDKPELCGTHTGDSCSYCGGSGLKGFQCQSDPVAEVQHGPFDDVGHPQWVRVATLGDFDLEHIPDGTKLFMAPSEQPAPVAVVMPDDWEDQLFAEMSRRFDLRKMIDDDHMVYDDTQIGVEFARDWIKARLNGVNS